MKHHYGPQVTFVDSPALLDVLSQLCSPQTTQPLINEYVRFLYSHLLTAVVSNEFETNTVEITTRMGQFHPQHPLKTPQIKKNQKAVSVNLARAGTYPSHLCYEQLHLFLKPENIRQDHIFAARMTNDTHHVTGTQLEGCKIGGPVENSMVLIPDPMGATGATIISSVEHYKKNVPGPARKYIAMHLIVTPEYLKNVLKYHPDIKVYALRLDRGLSPAAVLASEPGLHWDQEIGLNDHDYIVPGGGGFGEIMNNSFI